MKLDAKKFNNEQYYEIILGHWNNVDINIYADPNLSSLQMREIRKGLENNVDVSKYNYRTFTSKKMREIRLFLEEKISLPIVAITVLNWWELFVLRKILKDKNKKEISNAEYSELSDQINEELTKIREVFNE